MSASIASDVSDDTARLRVLDAIKAIAGPVTVSDVVARTGLPPHAAEEQLSNIVREYESELDVDDDGNLVYRFDPGLAAREDIVKADAKRRRKARWRQIWISFFKSWTIAMIVVYFVLYVALMIAAFVAASQAKGNNNSSSSRRRSYGGGYFWLMWTGSSWGYGGYGAGRSRRYRRRYNRDVRRRLEQGEDPYKMTAEADKADAKPGLKDRLWYFLFGSESVVRNPLAREKELLTYIRAKKGFISNADIIALLGVTYDEADAIGTRLVATYEGEMDLTDDGVAIYRFPNLLLTGAPEVQEQSPDLGYLWQVRKKEHTLRMNPVRWLPILNGVNMVLAFAVWFYALPQLGMTGIGFVAALVWFPLFFSICFFAVAWRRKARENKDKHKYTRDNIRISIFQQLFTTRRPVKVPSIAVQQSGLGPFDKSLMRELAPAIAKELRGTATEQGDGYEIRAERVWKEMATVDKLRSKAVSTHSIGRTVFSTRTGGTGDGSTASGELSASAGQGGDDLAAEIAALEAELGQPAE